MFKAEKMIAAIGYRELCEACPNVALIYSEDSLRYEKLGYSTMEFDEYIESHRGSVLPTLKEWLNSEEADALLTEILFRMKTDIEHHLNLVETLLSSL